MSININDVTQLISPVINNIKYDLPIPKLNPDQRYQRRLARRNERFLFKNKSLSGKDILSIYHKDLDLQICSKDEWLDTDNTEINATFDFSKTFFEQFYELSKKTKKQNLILGGNNTNSDYAHFCGYLKDCYLLFDSGKSEDCLYGVYNIYCKNCIDCSFILHSEYCYQSTNLKNCYKVLFSDFSRNCNNSAFIYDCTGCSNCLFCTNLSNAKYHIFNKQVTKEEFEKAWNNIFSHDSSKIDISKIKFKEFIVKNNTRENKNINSDNCTGNLLHFCENVQNSYNCSESKNLFFCHDLHAGNENCIDFSGFGEGANYCYELTASGGYFGSIGISACYFSSYIFYGGYNILYSSNCHEQCSDLFGCTDLRRKQYCILNKQYSKQEYFTLIPKIIAHMKETGEWGEFFPINISLFPYNHSLANEFFPLEENVVKNMGLLWINEINEFSQPNEQNIIKCKISGKLFRLIDKELEFYKDFGLGKPDKHYYFRHLERMNF